jgi:hypothetical protein
MREDGDKRAVRGQAKMLQPAGSRTLETSFVFPSEVEALL